MVFIGLRAQRDAVFECGVVGDDRGDVLKRLSVNVATDALPAINLAGLCEQAWLGFFHVDGGCSQ